MTAPDEVEETPTVTIPKVEIDSTPPVPNHPCAVCQHDADGHETGKDDHPMIHTLDPQWVDLHGWVHEYPSFHFDCLPGDMRYRLGNDDTHPQHRNIREAIKAAEGGKHGAELRKFIHDQARQYNDNAVGLGGHHTDGLKGDTVRELGAPVDGPVGPQADTAPVKDEGGAPA